MKISISHGASGKLVQAVAKKFLNENYYVVGTIIPNDPVVINIKNQNFETVIVDLMNEDGSQKFIESVIAKQNTIDAAILTVGGFAMGKIADTKTSDVTKQLKLNFETAY